MSLEWFKRHFYSWVISNLLFYPFVNFKTAQLYKNLAGPNQPRKYGHVLETSNWEEKINKREKNKSYYVELSASNAVHKILTIKI